MRTKNISFMIASVLATLFLISCVSAVDSTVLDVAITNQVPATINPGEEITINLDVGYTGDAENGIDVNWEGINPSDTSFWTLPADLHLDQEDSVSTSFKFLVPQNYQSGTINAVLRADAGTTAQDVDFSTIVNSITSISVPNDTTMTPGQTQVAVTIENTGNTELNDITLSATGAFDVTISPTSIDSLAAGATQDITLTVTSDISDLITGHVTLTATDGTVTDSGKISLAGEYCEYGNVDGDLKMDLKIKNRNGFGDDEEWYPFDEIEVEIEVKNKGDYDTEDLEIEWGLYNTETGEWFIDDEESDFNLDDGDKETKTITFSLDDDIDELEDGKFIFYARATGVIDDSDSPNDGASTCVSKSETIDVITDDEFVVLGNLQAPNTAQCGEDIEIEAEAWNLDSNDQDDVYVKIYNKNLDIDKEVVIGDINAFDSEDLDVLVNIPADATEGTYEIKLKVYNDNDEIYETDKDNDEAEFSFLIDVGGNCVSASQASVSATLESGGKAGEEMKIKATITNTGDASATYALNAVNYADWADSATVSQSSLTLDKGASQSVTITFNVNSATSGDKTFDIEVTSGNSLVKKQPVSVSIESASARFGITGNAILGDNWYLWAIGALNVILVLIIIIVALRVARS